MSTPYASLEIALGEALLRTTADAILLVDDTSWRVVAFNESAGRLYGGAAAKLVGAALETLFRLEGESAVERAIWRARTEPAGVELHLEVPDGKRHVRVRGRRCETAQGSICVLSLQDLTESETLAQELARARAEQQALLDDLGIGLLVLDAGGRVLRHNRFLPLEEVFGPTIAGRNFFLDIARGDDARPVFQRFHAWSNALTRDAYRETFEVEIGRRACEAELHAGGDTNAGAAVVRLVDVTARKFAEEQLRQQVFQAEEASRYATIAAETGGLVLGSLDAAQALETAAAEACRVLGASHSQVVEITPDARVRILLDVNRSGGPESLEFSDALDDNPVIAEVSRTLQPIGVDQLAGHPLADRDGLVAAVGARSLAAAPVTHDRELRAILLVHQRDRVRQWSEAELSLLAALGGCLGVALHNAAAHAGLLESHKRHVAVGELAAATRAAGDVEDLLAAAAAFFARALGPALFVVSHPALATSGAAALRVWRTDEKGALVAADSGPGDDRLVSLCASAAPGGLLVAEFDGMEALVAPLSSGSPEPAALALVGPSLAERAGRDVELVNLAAGILGPELASAALLSAVMSAKLMWERTFDAMSDGIVVHDESLEIVRVNKAFARLLRLSPGRLVGTRLQDLLDPANGEVFERACERVTQSRRPLTFDIDDAALGGTVSVSSSPLKAADGTFFIHTIRDITDERQMQDRLAQASKMASIGGLAAGVAHEINTPLATITGCAQSLGRQLASLPELTESAKWPAVNERLTTIVEQSFRCKKITRDLLDFAKPTKPSFHSCDLARIASESVETVARDRDPGLASVSVAGEPWPVTTDPDLARQILINLVVNALDASPDGERVRVEVRYLKRLVKVAVRDRGAGIPANELERIFDPFYTTKPPGRGTGLGLSISRSIASSLGGRIDVRSELDRGSTFTLALPRDPHRRAFS